MNQYQSIAFDFKPDLDFSLLPGNDYVLDFWVKGNTPDVKFDVRFIDTKTSSTDRPWRMGKTIDNSIATWDNTWKKISLPLKSLEEKGSYDNGWFPPEGKFDWRVIDRFEIVAEHQSLSGIEFWFDDIRLVGNEIPYEEVVTQIDKDIEYFEIYPNPTQGDATIRFSLPEGGVGTLSIYSMQGKLIHSLVDGYMEKGEHLLELESVDYLQAGVYLVEFQMDTSKLVRKFVKLN